MKHAARMPNFPIPVKAPRTHLIQAFDYIAEGHTMDICENR